MGYKIECEACGGSNFYVTEHNSMGYCFNCGFTKHGNHQHISTQRVRSPYLDDIRAFYTRMADYYHAQLEGEALAYVYARGYTDTTIQDLKIGFVPEDKSLLYRNSIAKEAGLSTYDGGAFLANRITFPYLDRKGTVTDIRARDITGNDTLKYKSPYGGTYYRGADYPYNYVDAQYECVLLTEGEIKVGVARQNRYPTLGLPGMGSWRVGWKPRIDQKVIIVFDRQDDDIWNIRRAIKRIITYIPTPYVATLPHMGQRKMDIDTLLLNYDRRIFDIVIKAAIPADQWLVLHR